MTDRHISLDAAMPHTLELAWLVERSDLDGASLHYMMLTGYGMGWTPDPNAATKFATAADALNECNGGTVDGPLRVVEHGWHNPRRPTGVE